MRDTEPYSIPAAHTELLDTAITILRTQRSSASYSVRAYNGKNSVTIRMTAKLSKQLELLPGRSTSLIELPSNEWALVLTHQGRQLVSACQGTRVHITFSGIQISSRYPAPLDALISENIVIFPQYAFTIL